MFNFIYLLRLCCVGYLPLILLSDIFATRQFDNSVFVQPTTVWEDVALSFASDQLIYVVCFRNHFCLQVMVWPIELLLLADATRSLVRMLENLLHTQLESFYFNFCALPIYLSLLGRFCS